MMQLGETYKEAMAWVGSMLTLFKLVLGLTILMFALKIIWQILSTNESGMALAKDLLRQGWGHVLATWPF